MFANLKALIRRVIIRTIMGETITELETATLTPELETLIDEELAAYIAANP